MKIAIDISQAVYGTGVSRYTKELVKGLLSIDSKNQYVLFGSSLRQFFSLKAIAKTFKNYDNVNFKIIPIPLKVFEIFWNRLHILPIELFIGKIDLVHTSDWLEPPVKSTTRKITTVHDMLAYLFPNSSHPKIVANQKAKLKLVKKESKIIIADSQTTKDDLIKFLQIPPDLIEVIYLAASSQFKPQDEDKVENVLRKYKIKNPYILSVSTQEPRKNIQKLIDVFETLSKNREITLVLTGKKAWATYQNSIDDESKIIFTGYVPEEDLICLYSGCRMFIYPSLYEGFGLPILEAMACGAPVITSNNSSIAEIAKDAAILIDPRSENQIAKAIEMLLDLKLDDYQKMVNASLNRARKYSWTKTAKQTLQIYRQVASDSQKKAPEKKNKLASEEAPIKQLTP